MCVWGGVYKLSFHDEGRKGRDWCVRTEQGEVIMCWIVESHIDGFTVRQTLGIRTGA